MTVRWYPYALKLHQWQLYMGASAPTETWPLVALHPPLTSCFA